MYVDDGIQLEFDAVFSAPVGDSEESSDIPSIVTPPDLFVCLRVERVARYCENVELLVILLHPSLGDFAAIAHDADAFNRELLFSIAQ